MEKSQKAGVLKNTQWGEENHRSQAVNGRGGGTNQLNLRSPRRKRNMGGGESSSTQKEFTDRKRVYMQKFRMINQSD